MVFIDSLTKINVDFLLKAMKYPLKERLFSKQEKKSKMSHIVKTIETKYMFQMQHVFKVKLTLLSFKSPKFLLLETHDQEAG